MPVEPNAIDLTTLSDVKQYVIPSGSNATEADDALLCSLITRASQYILTRTSRDTLGSEKTYTEIYDGNGKDSLLLRNYPVIAVSAVQIGNFTVTASPGFNQAGYAINSNQTGIVLLRGQSGPTFFHSGLFHRGRMNVSVSYKAGYPNGAPADIADCCIKIVALNYQKKDRLDQASIALPQGGGTSSYRDLEIPKDCERVIQMYRRRTW